MIDIIKQIRDRASVRNAHIILPESEDPRVLKAATYLSKNNICKISLVGNAKEILEKAKQHGVKLHDSIRMLDSLEKSNYEKFASFLIDKNRHKKISLKKAEELAQNSLYAAAIEVAMGEADGAVAGSITTTGNVIKSALQCIGVKTGTSLVSSIFLMAFPDGKVLTYADCGVVPYPDKDQLADIAIESARTHKLLTQSEPRVAMLSFSTKGSANHERVELVQQALQKAQQKDPALFIDGEFQFDAAFIPEVARRKAPGSKVAGSTNVFIFPNLDAGNIAYKITERLGGASATGPILQGLARPMMDLSRGCKWKDIVNAACVAILMDD